MKDDVVKCIFLFSSASCVECVSLSLLFSEIFSSFFMIMMAINVRYKYMNGSMILTGVVALCKSFVVAEKLQLKCLMGNFCLLSFCFFYLSRQQFEESFPNYKKYCAKRTFDVNGFSFAI